MIDGTIYHLKKQGSLLWNIEDYLMVKNMNVLVY